MPHLKSDNGSTRVQASTVDNIINGLTPTGPSNDKKNKRKKPTKKEQAKDQANEQLLNRLTEWVNNFLNDTQEARELSERDRDYLDHKQWTREEIQKLTKRRQAPIVVNRIKPKVAALVGLIKMRQTDPKAFPRTQKHEDSSHAITDALRFVADNTKFQRTKMKVGEEFFVEGYGGAIVDVKENGAEETEVSIDRIPWDRIYYDPHSRENDFSDASYMGIILWMNKDQLVEIFPDVDPDSVFLAAEPSQETFEDRPKWIMRDNSGRSERVRVSWTFFRVEGVWHHAMFSDNTFLLEPEVSPYQDEFKQPTNPIELVSAYVDRENRRYGEVRGMIDQQDEINHRRSKALHLLSVRQTMSTKGAINVDEVKRELAKPDGHIELNGKTEDFVILPTGDMAQGQFDLYLDAKNEINAVSINGQLSSARNTVSEGLSGRAVGKLQAADMLELNQLFEILSDWHLRIYTQVWARVKQFWTEEKWLRVTDDQDSLRWTGLNAQVTAQQFLEETINDESQPIGKRRSAAAAFQQMVAVEDPRLQDVIEIKNPVAELDVDIILDESFDSVNIQEEQFDMLAQFAQGTDVDIIDLIELSQLRNKEELIAKIQARRQANAQASGNAIQVQTEETQANTAETLSKTEVNKQDAISKQIENIIVASNPEKVSSISI